MFISNYTVMKKNYRPINEIVAEMLGAMKAELAAELHDEARQAVKNELESRELPPIYLSRTQAAAALGVSLPTLHALMNSGRLEYIKIGSSTKISKEALEAAMKNGLRKYQRRAR